MKKINIKLNPDQLADLCEDTDNWYISIDDSADKNELLELIDIHYGDNFYSKLVLSEVAKHKSADVQILRKLFELGDININVSIAANPNIDKDLSALLHALNDEFINERLKLNFKYKKINN